MFTGLVELRGIIERLEPCGPGLRLVIGAGAVSQTVQLGDSIAISGCCLTVVEVAGQSLAFEAGAETLSRTTLGKLQVGSLVNLERSLRVGDRLGGHFVSGHVDTLGRVDERSDDENWSTFWFAVEHPYTAQMASKGSVAVDGVSLTLVDVEPDRFSVALIPHTLAVTTLGTLRPGDLVNIETDILAKYVAQQLRERF